MRNAYRTANRSAKGIELLRSLAIEPVRVRIQCIILQIFKHATVVFVSSAFGGEGHVANLRELSTIIEGRHVYGRNSLLRRISILKRPVLPYVCGRDTIDRKVHHR